MVFNQFFYCGTILNLDLSWKLKGNPPPNATPQEIAGLITGLLGDDGVATSEGFLCSLLEAAQHMALNLRAMDDLALSREGFKAPTATHILEDLTHKIED